MWQGEEFVALYGAGVVLKACESVFTESDRHHSAYFVKFHKPFAQPVDFIAVNCSHIPVSACSCSAVCLALHVVVDGAEVVLPYSCWFARYSRA